MGLSMVLATTRPFVGQGRRVGPSVPVPGFYLGLFSSFTVCDRAVQPDSIIRFTVWASVITVTPDAHAVIWVVHTFECFACFTTLFRYLVAREKSLVFFSVHTTYFHLMANTF